MKAIHKYALPPVGSTSVATYEGARFIHAAEQHGQITVWAEVNTRARESTCDVYVVPTGGDVPLAGDHLGTVLLEDGRFVLHVYVGRNR